MDLLFVYLDQFQFTLGASVGEEEIGGTAEGRHLGYSVLLLLLLAVAIIIYHFNRFICFHRYHNVYSIWLYCHNTRRIIFEWFSFGFITCGLHISVLFYDCSRFWSIFIYFFYFMVHRNEFHRPHRSAPLLYWAKLHSIAFNRLNRSTCFFISLLHWQTSSNSLLKRLIRQVTWHCRNQGSICHGNSRNNTNASHLKCVNRNESKCLFEQAISIHIFFWLAFAWRCSNNKNLLELSSIAISIPYFW